jgi:hypothetical protein
MRFYRLVFVLLTFSAWAESPIPGRSVQSNSLTNPVQAYTGETGVYGTGMIYARPTRGKRNTGIILKSDEMHLVVGNFQDDNKYSGNTWDVSTKDVRIFDKNEGLDRDKHYIYKYWYSYPFHFQKQSTYTMVTDITDAKEPQDFLKSGLPVQLEVINGKRGTYTQNAVTVGRMVEVFRWNTYLQDRPICSFVLDQGGSKRTSQSPVANELTFNVYSEEACQYVETLLPYGLELEVTYDTAYVTKDRYDDFATKITVVKIPAVSLQHSNSFLSNELNGQERAILNDPQFQAHLQELVKSTWERMYGPAAQH